VAVARRPSPWQSRKPWWCKLQVRDVAVLPGLFTRSTYLDFTWSGSSRRFRDLAEQAVCEEDPWTLWSDVVTTMRTIPAGRAQMPFIRVVGAAVTEVWSRAEWRDLEEEYED